MRTSICAIGILFCLILISYPLAQEKTYFEYYRNGIKAYSEQDYAKAVELLTQSVELNPYRPSLLYQLARSHAQLGHDKEALSWVEKAVILKG